MKLPHKNIFLSAFVYGLFVWAVMTLVVVPNSAINKSIIPFDFVASAKAVFILMICIALPDAYFAKKYYAGSRYK